MNLEFFQIIHDFSVHFFHVLHFRTGGAFRTPSFQILQIVFLALCKDLHTSIVTIPDPSCNAARVCLTLRLFAEKDALDMAGDF